MIEPTRLVVDASVVLKWALPEPRREAASKILDSAESGTVDLVAPAVLAHEIASALARRYRTRDLTAKQAGQAFVHLHARLPTLLDDEDLGRSAFRLAIEHQFSSWDALYIALAMRYRCDLITADARLRNAAVRHYPYVLLLGE